MPAKKTTKKSTNKSDTPKKTAKKIPVKDVSTKKTTKSETAKKTSGTKKKTTTSNPKTAPAAKKVDNRKVKIGMYRKIAGSFVVLTIALLAIIFYFTFIKMTITIIPEQEKISDNFVFNVYNDEDGEQDFSGEYYPGVIEEVEVSQEKEYEASGIEMIGEEVTGKVIIKNDYTKNQPLVANTRLLSPDNKMFRIKNTVNVPAGGEVEVEIYADEPSSEMAIRPTEFTIPGLWAGLQDKIYAVSNEDFIYQKEIKKHIQQSDIDSAIEDMKDFLVKKVENSFIEDYKGYNKVLFKIDDNSVDTELTGKVGEEKDSFQVQMTTNVVVIAFNEDQVIDQAKEKIRLSLPDGHKITAFNKEEANYEIDDYNLNQNIASINFSFSGKASLSTEEEIIDKQKIVGLTEKQLKDYLRGFEGIAGFEINFSPAFIKKVPNLVDRIEIKVDSK